MLCPRAAAILNSIAKQYIPRALPVSSTSVANDCGLTISSATIRNEMTRLEEEGYIFRPHHAAGSIPSDRGYRYYVGTLKDIELPLTERRLISHLFHQVEKRVGGMVESGGNTYSSASAGCSHSYRAQTNGQPIKAF